MKTKKPIRRRVKGLAGEPLPLCRRLSLCGDNVEQSYFNRAAELKSVLIPIHVMEEILQKGYRLGHRDGKSERK